MLRIIVLGYATAFAIVSFEPALAQEISRACNPVIGTFLTANKLHSDKVGTSRSLLVLTNGGHALRFDSDESIATTDRRAFGGSAGTWRCEGVDKDGTIHITAVMFDFTYPRSYGQGAEIARISLSGSFVPTVATLELEGKLSFLPMNFDAQEPAVNSRKTSSTIALSMRGTKITIPRSAQ